MKTIIAGTRTMEDYQVLKNAIKRSGFDITEVISGGCRGVDKLGEQWAKENSVPLVIMPAKWNKHGKAAGPIRNKEMAKCADAVIVVWDGQSRGTNHMIRVAKGCNLKVFVYMVKRIQRKGAQ